MGDLERIYGLDARNLENHLRVPSSVTSNLGIDVRFHFRFITYEIVHIFMPLSGQYLVKYRIRSWRCKRQIT